MIDVVVRNINFMNHGSILAVDGFGEVWYPRIDSSEYPQIDRGHQRDCGYQGKMTVGDV